jgi:hypothetical protein
VEQLGLVAGVPGPGQLMLVEDAEAHGVASRMSLAASNHGNAWTPKGGTQGKNLSPPRLALASRT